MKFKVFDAKSATVPGKIPTPALTMSRTGLFRPNVVLVEKLALEAGDLITLVQDEDRPTDWYITKYIETGVPVRFTKNGQPLFNHSTAAKELYATLGKEATETVRMQVATTPLVDANKAYYAIITKSAK